MEVKGVPDLAKESETTGESMGSGETSLTTRTFSLIGKNVRKRPGAIVLVILVITLLLLIPLGNVNTEMSMNDYIPDSEAVDADETIGKEFSGEINIIIIAEARKTTGGNGDSSGDGTGDGTGDGSGDGTANIFTAPVLLELLAIEQVLRSHEDVAPFLVEGVSIFSVEDAVQMVLMTQFNSGAGRCSGSGAHGPGYRQYCLPAD